MKDLTISCTDLTKLYNKPTPLIIELSDNGTGLAGKTVAITINSVTYRRTTAGDGKCSININLLPGAYPTSIKFDGDTTYNPATKDVVVRVIRNDTTQKTTKGIDHYFEVNKIPLKVIMSDGFSTKMGHNTKETTMLMDTNTNNAPTFFFNSGNTGIEFEVSVVIKEEYYYNNVSYRDYLDQWSKFMTPVSVVTDAIDVPNGKYVMSIKSKKQKDKVKSIWKLRFKQYYENSLSFENVYSEKIASLSSVDQVLVKYDLIDENSPKSAILALQKKLQQKGCWKNFYDELAGDGDEPWDTKRREPTGVWDSQMRIDIFTMQTIYHLEYKQGVCDRETIIAAIGDDYEGQSIIDQAHLLNDR